MPDDKAYIGCVVDTEGREVKVHHDNGHLRLEVAGEVTFITFARTEALWDLICEAMDLSRKWIDARGEDYA